MGAGATARRFAAVGALRRGLRCILRRRFVGGPRHRHGHALRAVAMASHLARACLTDRLHASMSGRDGIARPAQKQAQDQHGPQQGRPEFHRFNLFNTGALDIGASGRPAACRLRQPCCRQEHDSIALLSTMSTTLAGESFLPGREVDADRDACACQVQGSARSLCLLPLIGSSTRCVALSARLSTQGSTTPPAYSPPR